VSTLIECFIPETYRPRFLPKVRQSGACWLWIGGKTEGYGRFCLHRGVERFVHRLMYEWTFGSIPEGMQLDHLCRNRACCNPAHLEPVTRRENILRGASPHAKNARKTHCVNGHEFTPENTYEPPGMPGCRHCRLCLSERSRGRPSGPWRSPVSQAAKERRRSYHREYMRGYRGRSHCEC
jgi:hypothetical protein